MSDRLARINLETATPEQVAVAASLGEGRGRVPTTYQVWLHHPALAEGMERVGTPLKQSEALNEAEKEVAILATAVFWNAPYVTANHTRHAAKAGLSEEVIAAILAKRRVEGVPGRLGVVCDAVADILGGALIGDAAFERYAAELGRAAIAELLVTIGYYSSVALAMSFHGMEPKA